MNPFLFPTAALAIGVLATATVQTRTSVTAIPTSPFDRAWLPAPADLIALSDLDITGPVVPGGIVLANAEPLTIYTVPPDKWLVVTDVDFTYTCCDPSWIFESYGGAHVAKIKGNGRQPQQPAPLGWAFRPGSTVELMSPTGGSRGITYTIFGYLTPDR